MLYEVITPLVAPGGDDFAAGEHGVEVLVGEVTDAGPEKLFEGRAACLHTPAGIGALDGTDFGPVRGRGGAGMEGEVTFRATVLGMYP